MFISVIFSEIVYENKNIFFIIWIFFSAGFNHQTTENLVANVITINRRSAAFAEFIPSKILVCL
jgi:hypothetical protein